MTDKLYKIAMIGMIFITCTSALFTNSVIKANNDLELELQSQIELASDLDEQLNSFGELADIYPENRALVLAIAITESNGSYDVKHKDKDTKGIGGIKPNLWKTDNKTNSLMAIEEVIEALQEQYPKDSIYQTIKRYKGAINNLKSSDKCYMRYLELKGLL